MTEGDLGVIILETLDKKAFYKGKRLPFKKTHYEHDYFWMEWTSSNVFKENDFKNLEKFSKDHWWVVF